MVLFLVVLFACSVVWFVVVPCASCTIGVSAIRFSVCFGSLIVFVFYSVFVVHFVFSAVLVFRIMLGTSDVLFVTRKHCTECHVLFCSVLMKVSYGLVVVVVVLKSCRSGFKGRDGRGDSGRGWQLPCGGWDAIVRWNVDV